MHVRSLVLTEKHARLIHFDRAGTQVTPLIDIHRNPRTFVRLVAGLCSEHERAVGLDDSIQWTIVDGRKQQGTLTTTGPTGEAKVYPIVARIPVPRETIRGRATTCWRVKDPDTMDEYVVKDSWRPDDTRAEHELLELAKGIPGVIQMVSHEAGRAETKDFRCPSTVGGYRNRVATRITTKSYGNTVEHFTSMLQVICAIRDAIAGLYSFELLFCSRTYASSRSSATCQRRSPDYPPRRLAAQHPARQGRRPRRGPRHTHRFRYGI